MSYNKDTDLLCQGQFFFLIPNPLCQQQKETRNNRGSNKNSLQADIFTRPLSPGFNKLLELFRIKPPGGKWGLVVFIDSQVFFKRQLCGIDIKNPKG